MSQCHVAGTEPERAQCVTQTTWCVTEDAGGEESDEYDQAEEENQWGFQASWPTYRTAAVVLARILQQFRAGEPPDKRTLLALAWKTSLLRRFASGLRKLGRRHTTAPNEPGSLKNNSKKKWPWGEARAPKQSSQQQHGRCPWATQNVRCPNFSGSMSRGRRTPRTIGKSCGDWLSPCRQWLTRPRTLPSGRWWQQRYCRRWRKYASGRRRGSGSEDWTESEAQSRSGRKGQSQSVLSHSGGLGAPMGSVLALVHNPKIGPYPARQHRQWTTSAGTGHGQTARKGQEVRRHRWRRLCSTPGHLASDGARA